MMRSRLTVGLMLVMLLFACFLSIPVLSSELPWDADGDSSDGVGTDSDTTDNSENEADVEYTAGGYDMPGWLIGLMCRYSYPFVVGYLLNSRVSSGNCQNVAEEAGSGGPGIEDPLRGVMK